MPITPKVSRPLSVGTINNRIRTIKTFTLWLLDREMIKKEVKIKQLKDLSYGLQAELSKENLTPKKIYESEFQDFLEGSAAIDENGEPTIHFVGFDNNIPVVVNFNKKLSFFILLFYSIYYRVGPILLA